MYKFRVNKKYILILLVLFIVLVGSVFLFSKWKNDTVQTIDESKIKVLATIFPVYDLVREVGKDKIEAVLLVPPGASPHTFEMTPSLVKNTEGASLFFAVGAGLDEWSSSMINNLQTEGFQKIELDEFVTLRPFEEDADHTHEDEEGVEEKHEHGDYDPHYWLTPVNAKIMALKISEELSKIDGQNTEFYKNNAENFVKALDIKSLEWQNKIAGLSNKNLVVFHDAWGYFAEYFGLKVVATLEPFPGKAPSPKYILEVKEKINEHTVKAIFIEPQLFGETIKTFATDLNLDLGVMDPLGGKDGRNSYIELIEYNINEVFDKLN